MGDSGSDSLELSLAGDPTAAARAREVVRRTLARWHLPQLVDVCVLVVSELVTNALRYGKPPVGLRLRRERGKVSVDVHDRGEGLKAPVLPGDDELAESGRGLDIVHALADEAAIVDVPGEGTVARASWRLDDPPR